MHAELADKIADYLYSAPASEFQGNPIGVLDGQQGRDNLIWRVRSGREGDPDAVEAAVKLFLDAGQARGRRQFDGQSTFAPYQIAPQPLWFDRYPHGLSRQVLVYRWAQGQPLDTIEPGRVSQLAASLATTIATVHSAPAEDVRRFCPHPVNLDFFWRIEGDAYRQALGHLGKMQTPKLGELLEDLQVPIEQEIAAALPLWSAAAPTAVHGDLLPENCLVDPRGPILLLDWEMYGLGDPALDVARLLFHLQGSTESATLDLLTQSYLAQIEDETRHLRIDLYRKLLGIQALSYLLNGIGYALEQVQAATHVDAEASAIVQSLPLIADSLAALLAQAANDFARPAIAETSPAVVAQWQAEYTSVFENSLSA